MGCLFWFVLFPFSLFCAGIKLFLNLTHTGKCPPPGREPHEIAESNAYYERLFADPNSAVNRVARGEKAVSKPTVEPYCPAGPGYGPRKTEPLPPNPTREQLWEYYRKQNNG